MIVSTTKTILLWNLIKLETKYLLYKLIRRFIAHRISTSFNNEFEVNINLIDICFN